MTKMIVPPLQLLFHQRPLLPPLLLKKAQLPKLQSHQHQHFQEIQIWPVEISSTYRPERSDENLDKHCFAYNVRITNDSPK